jgi:hypothetical protein
VSPGVDELDVLDEHPRTAATHIDAITQCDERLRVWLA